MDVLTDRLCVMLLLLMMNRLHHSHFNIFETWLMADNICQRHGSFSGVYAGLSIESSRMKSTPLLYSLPWDCTRFRSTWPLGIGYRLRWRSDIWRTDRGVVEVRSPGIRPATDDDIRHNAPGLLETVDQLLRIKVRRKLLNQDKPSRLASYALQQHKAKSARLAASEFSFLLAVLRRSRWVRAVEQA